MPNDPLINFPKHHPDEPCDRLAEAQHRLGTELGVIFACCYELREGAGRPLPPDAVVLLHRIQRSAESIRDLRNLLIGIPRD